MDLRTWILEEHAALADRLARTVEAHVPPERWREHVDGGGSTVAFVLFHAAWHADLAITTAVRARPPLLAEWRHRLGLAGAAPAEGLGETEPHHLTADLHLGVLPAYVHAVHDDVHAWLARTPVEALDEVPPAGERIEHLAGVSAHDVPWLHALWAGRPAAWFVQWEAIGHRQGHLGELAALRARMGLSPF